MVSVESKMTWRAWLYFFVVLLGCHQGTGFGEAEWNRRRMKNAVVPLYAAAYQALHDDIIQRILQFDRQSNRLTDNNTSTGLFNATASLFDDVHVENEEETTTANYLRMPP